MKKTISCLVVLIGLCSLILFTSFIKEDPIKAKTKTELLCASSWKVYEFTLNPVIAIAGTGVTDYFDLVPSCAKDDIDIYINDGTGLNDKGPTKCIESDPQSRTFYWNFNPSETQLIRGTNDTSDIVQLDDKY